MEGEVVAKGTKRKCEDVIAPAKTARKASCLVVVGLGSVGEEFQNQRHNVGARVVGRAGASQGGVAAPCVGALGTLSVGGKDPPWLLLGPQGAINDSGPTLRSALEALGHPDASFLVVSDDCSLPLGVIRMRRKGSSGGHNGLRSIEQVFGPNYHRLKVGIGGKPTKEHVSGEFAGEEAKLADAVEARAAEAVGLWLDLGPEGMEQVMAKVNNPSFCNVEKSSLVPLAVTAAVTS